MANEEFSRKSEIFRRKSLFLDFNYRGSEEVKNVECQMGNEEFDNNIRFYVTF